MNRHFRWTFVVLAIVSLIRAEVVSTSPSTFGDKTLLEYVPSQDVYIDHNKWFDIWTLGLDSVKYARTYDSMNGRAKYPPVKKIVFSFRTDFLCEHKKYIYASMMFLVQKNRTKRRFVLINSEQAINEIVGEDTTRYRVWPHLGLLYVGTAANEKNFDVVLWDELVQGYAPMEQLVQPGDVVGLSLVATGIERGVVLARKAKELGAQYVVAGNDSAIFRANQLLNLDGKPIDAVFTGNSLTAIRQFFRQIGDTPIEQMQILGVQTMPGAEQRSNVQSRLRKEFVQLVLQRQADPKRFEDDAFLIPRFDLFPVSYWEKVWSNYRATFGHKFSNSNGVKNATALFAQGCTGTCGHDVCSYCTIAGVADIRIPRKESIVKMAEAYKRFGIDAIYNVTDSVYEMAPAVAAALRGVNPWKALTIYGRAQGVAQHPEYLDQWLALASEHLVINMGQDSGDERILIGGVMKSSQKSKARVGENRLATGLIAKSGAFLHASFIFGSPGETRETCESTLVHIDWMAKTLGSQFDTCESDVYWLNFGSPASQVFYDYNYAKQLAEKTGKTITEADWQRDFADHCEALVVPSETERAWYHHFTRIDYDEAHEFIARADKIMATIPGSIARRGYNPNA